MKKTLIFEENFSQPTLNPDIWTFEVGDKWHNNESQCYVDDSNNLYIGNVFYNVC